MELVRAQCKSLVVGSLLAVLLCVCKRCSSTPLIPQAQIEQPPAHVLNVQDPLQQALVLIQVLKTVESARQASGNRVDEPRPGRRKQPSDYDDVPKWRRFQYDDPFGAHPNTTNSATTAQDVTNPATTPETTTAQDPQQPLDLTPTSSATSTTKPTINTTTNPTTSHSADSDSPVTTTATTATTPTDITKDVVSSTSTTPTDITKYISFTTSTSTPDYGEVQKLRGSKKRKQTTKQTQTNKHSWAEESREALEEVANVLAIEMEDAQVTRSSRSRPRINLYTSTRYPVPLPENHAFCYTNPNSALCKTFI